VPVTTLYIYKIQYTFLSKYFGKAYSLCKKIVPNIGSVRWSIYKFKYSIMAAAKKKLSKSDLKAKRQEKIQKKLEEKIMKKRKSRV